MENIQYPAPEHEYKVLVRCATFNQSKYIEDALNGFAIQQTNFPFVCLVMDDASTDGEQDVIREWMKRECDMNKAETIVIPTSLVIIVPHKTNISCTFVFYLLKQNLYGTGKKKYYSNPWREKCKYEAICEGDDYWIDPLKLQKQVDFLEVNPEYTMCFHNAFISIIKEGKRYAEIFNPENDEYDLTFEDAIKKWHVPTASMLMRKEARENYPSYIKQIYSGDITLILVLALRGKIRFMNEIMSVYRKVDDGTSASQKVRGSYYFSQITILYESFLKAPELNTSQILILNQQIKYYRLLHDYHLIKERKEYYRFFSPKYWKLLLYKLIKWHK